jgi:hypothetical protein
MVDSGTPWDAVASPSNFNGSADVISMRRRKRRRRDIESGQKKDVKIDSMGEKKSSFCPRAIKGKRISMCLNEVNS